ncbi:hypothetical protein C8Q78DRAFT_997613 [Trametes maxima]|nr:hypothetical protein C8Q78DRAFT_997613 [Trametes maxima]
MTRTSKKRKVKGPDAALTPLADAGATTPEDLQLRKSPLTVLPLELLAEVLSYSSSPRDVLSLSRTCKYFHTTLVNNPSTDFIWRQARTQPALGAIPDPMPGMSEATCAALLFDSGVCENCGKKTHVGFYSFALRVRICDNKKQCLPNWVRLHLHQITEEDEVLYPDLLQWIPRMERSGPPFHEHIFVRRREWQAAIDERKMIHLLGPDVLAAYLETKQTLADALPAQMAFYTKLLARRDIFENGRNMYHAIGRETADRHAMQLGCTRWQILQSPTYSTLHYAKMRCWERWDEDEFDTIKDMVTTEIASQKEKKTAREIELALREKRSGVEAQHTQLKRSNPDLVLPSLAEFRKLSVVKTVEASASKKDPDLKHPFVASILKDNLDQWRDAARAGLASVLGFPGWRTTSKRKLHPVDRLTARFRCKKCHAPSKETSKDVGMDLIRVCEHVCATSNKKVRGTQRWNADNFVPDQRAVDAISQVLELCGTKAEDVDSVKIADSVGDRVRCSICALNMDVRSVGRHCKRHEESVFTLLPEVAAPGSAPLEHGLTTKLIQGGAKFAAQQDMKVFSCRHCVHDTVPPNAAEPDTTANGDQEGTGLVPQRPKLMSFNGLRSHLKEKHHVEWIGDEDVLRHKDAPAVDST